MATMASEAVSTAPIERKSGLVPAILYWLGNWKLTTGLILILILVLFSGVGRLFVPYEATDVAHSTFGARPSARHPLGTDNVGRDVLALMIYGIPPTLTIGIIAGSVGIFIGTTLGVASGYFGGKVDDVIRTITDVALTIPSLMMLVVIASYLRTTSIELTAIIIAIFAWPGPTRSIRAQTLSMRERPFIPLAKLSGLSDLQICFGEILPNLIPFIAAGFVGSVSGAVLASVGIQLLGLGPLFVPNLGMILQFAFRGAALFRGLWWWWMPPAIALVQLFIGLFLISIALDEYANPKLRARVG